MSGTIIQQGLTNHVTFVIDQSDSMYTHEKNVVRAMDAQIKSLAEMSQKMDQETRVTVVLFATDVKVLVYDKDVLRLPSIAPYYRPSGMTALVDATVQAIDDLAKIPELYSDHAYLVFVLTDGQENQSRKNTPSTLKAKVDSLKDNWTVAALVPDAQGEQNAIRYGFPAGNILQWDVRTEAGFQKAAQTIHTATQTFMENRAKGIRGSRAVFSTGAEAVNTQTVKENLTPLSPTSYHLVHVTSESAAQYPKSRDWVEKEAGLKFRLGCLYYQLTKTETIQPQKNIAVLEKKTDRVYSGPEVRDLIGLPDMSVRVKPDFNPDYAIFVQSTSTNRKLMPNTKVLLFP